ncbi:MAG: hypothetical protein IJP02_03645 [Oscillospiraceae bacterium]|nr:hypothetical protein [Oscillospiraceae bacterium]
MSDVIFEPLTEYENRLKQLHLDKTTARFDHYTRQSGVNIEENRATVKQYDRCMYSLKKLRRKRFWLKVLRVVMCITILLIPLVIFWLTPKIRALNDDIDHADQKGDDLLAQAEAQMASLNGLFGDRDGLELIEQTLPLLRFAPHYSVEHEADMVTNYDYTGHSDPEQSSLEVLAGRYNENPFLFENKLIHTMGTEVYHGSKTIYWTEYYTDGNGKRQSRTRSEVLHATVTKPKPFYSTQVVLKYGSQGAPELSFTRDATHLDRKGEGALERYVKRGEKKLKRMTDKAVKDNRDFVSMSNTRFEVLFDALDRTDEVQFRTLFTPLAQTNMVEILLSQSGYGDDFNFIKQRRMNTIVSKHSQGREISLSAKGYRSYSYDIARDNYINQNVEFFKAVYFDFAPLLAIPAYQERPVHSLKPIPDYAQLYSCKECEVLANCLAGRYVEHPKSKTPSIRKSTYVATRDNSDQILITAHSYDTIARSDIVPVFGGDGRYHNVVVPWDEYIPLTASGSFAVTSAAFAAGKSPLAHNNGLCIYKL